MKGLALLMRLAQYELEERRSDLGSINRTRAETETALGRHDDTVVREAAIAMADPASIAAFGVWAGQAARGRTTLQNRRDELEANAHAAHGRVHDAAVHKRRLEIVLDERHEQVRRRTAKNAEAKADERELTRHATTGSAQ